MAPRIPALRDDAMVGPAGGKAGSPTRLHARADRTCPSGAVFQGPRPVRGSHRNRSPHRHSITLPTAVQGRCSHFPQPVRPCAGVRGISGRSRSVRLPVRGWFHMCFARKPGHSASIPLRTAGFGRPAPKDRSFRWRDYAVPAHLLSRAINGLKNPGWQKYARRDSASGKKGRWPRYWSLSKTAPPSWGAIGCRDRSVACPLRDGRFVGWRGCERLR